MTQTFDVKACRVRLGLNQLQFGQQVGVTERQIRRWEKHQSAPRPACVLRMRALLLRCAAEEPTITTKAKAAPQPAFGPIGILPANF